MSTSTDTIEQLATQEYKYGFTTDVEADSSRRGSTSRPSGPFPSARRSPSGCSSGG